MALKKQSKSPATLTECIIRGIQDKKGHRIIAMNFGKIKYAICDEFIICHGASKTQVEAIADHVRDLVKKELNVSVWHTEGYENAEWILLDYFDVVLHVFMPDAREFYNLEGLWADADIRQIEAGN